MLSNWSGPASKAAPPPLILLTTPVNVASAERSFSRLKLIKNILRSTMTHDRLLRRATERGGTDGTLYRGPWPEEGPMKTSWHDIVSYSIIVLKVPLNDVTCMGDFLTSRRPCFCACNNFSRKQRLPYIWTTTHRWSNLRRTRLERSALCVNTGWPKKVSHYR